jgi:ABC-type multidrug transport system fused ATPase/permease subunit
VRQWHYLSKLIRFAFAQNPLLYVSVAVSLVSVVIELLAMSSLYPLFQMVSTGRPAANGIIPKLFALLNVAPQISALLWIFLGLLALRIITQVAAQTLSMRLGKNVQAQLGSRAFEQIIHNLPIRDVTEKSIGFFIGLAGDESFRASTLIISLTQFISSAALAALYFAAIAQASTAVALLVLVFLLISSFALLFVLRISHRLGATQTVESRRASSVFLDSLNNLKTVRAFSAETYVVEFYRKLIFGYTKVLFWIEEVSMLARLVPLLLLLLIFSAWMAWRGASLGNAGLALIVTMIVYLMRFFPVVGEGARLLFKIVSDARSGKDVTAIIDTPPQTYASRDALIDDINHIELRSLGFSYNGEERKATLRDVNARFESGKSYALTGRSGVGKSTLVDLLMKFYSPTAGGIFINGVAVANISESAMRQQIILVSQDPAIFDDTIFNNVCLGLKASLMEVQAACEKACIHELITEMPDGYYTRLQYQGKNLSGGQRQRIAIARVLLRSPAVLILDESTSALDKQAQDRVIENLLAEYRHKILIFVTHDPRVMQQVDEVVDLQKINAAERFLGADPAVTQDTVSPIDH